MNYLYVPTLDDILNVEFPHRSSEIDPLDYVDTELLVNPGYTSKMACENQTLIIKQSLQSYTKYYNLSYYNVNNDFVTYSFKKEWLDYANSKNIPTTKTIKDTDAVNRNSPHWKVIKKCRELEEKFQNRLTTANLYKRSTRVTGTF